MEQIPTLALLARLGREIELRGIANVPAGLVATVVDRARSVGVRPVALAVLADPAEPDVARERAFSLVVMQVLGRSRGRGAGDAGAPPHEDERVLLAV